GECVDARFARNIVRGDRIGDRQHDEHGGDEKGAHRVAPQRKKPAGLDGPPAYAQLRRWCRQSTRLDFCARFPVSTSAVEKLPFESTARLCTQWNWPALRPLRPNLPMTSPLRRSKITMFSFSPSAL